MLCMLCAVVVVAVVAVVVVAGVGVLVGEVVVVVVVDVVDVLGGKRWRDSLVRNTKGQNIVLCLGFEVRRKTKVFVWPRWPVD